MLLEKTGKKVDIHSCSLIENLYQLTFNYSRIYMYMYKTLYLQSKKHHLEESGWEEEFNSLFPYKQIESGNTHVKKPRNILHKKNFKTVLDAN